MLEDVITKVKQIIFDKGFQRCAILLFIVECVMGALVAVKGGNIDAYLGIIVPELLVLMLMLGYAIYLRGDTTFALCCSILLQIGTCMQCLIQKDNSGYALKYQLILIMSVLAAVIVLLLYEKVISQLDVDKILLLIVALTVLIYLVLLVFGKRIGGAKAWIVIGGFSLQPTEFLKILAVFYFAIVFCGYRTSDKNKLIYSISYMAVNGVFSLLIREMGSLLIMGLVFVSFCILFLDSGKLLAAFAGIFAGVGALGLGSLYMILNQGKAVLAAGKELGFFLSKLYPVASNIAGRISIWLDPSSDPLGKGYQGMKALEAMSLGGLLGSNYSIRIPVEESDFIFVSVILNMGVLIAILIVLLFLAIFVLGVKRYLNCDGGIEAGIIAGCVFFMVYQSLIMIFGSTGFFVMTGVPIAFISDGGTAMMTVFIETALILYLGAEDYVSTYWSGELPDTGSIFKGITLKNPLKGIHLKK